MTEKYDLIEEVYPGIFLNQIILPNNPLKYINNYIIKSRGEIAMVDSCFDLPESVARMEELIDYHQIDLKQLKLVCTHLHSDHTGMASRFTEKGTELFMSTTDGNTVTAMVDARSPHWLRLNDHARWQGLAEDGLRIEDHPGFRYRPKEPLDFTPLDPGDRLTVGEYHFEIIDLRGHTPGMIGLYEPDHRLFFCGDHILGKITPNITFWTMEFDALASYFEKLELVRTMEIKHLFSAHRFLIKDHRARIDELFAHHKNRLDESIACLRDRSPCTVRQVTKNLQWDISAKSWDDFPKPQKWFAAGEAHAHLEYLYHWGDCQREERGGILYYST